MSMSLIVCCKLYISESRNAHVLESIERVVRLHPQVVVTNRFKDDIYNRTNYTLVSQSDTDSLLDATSLRTAVLGMVEAAFENIDLRSHCGSHPRLGVVDHICFHPLADTTLDEVATLSNSVAADIAHKFQVPIYLYGAAHTEGRTLECIRRELGYFQPNQCNQWKGEINPDIMQVKPDEGPTTLTPSKGLVIIGASKWVGTYNVPLYTGDAEAVKQIARSVCERGGGLHSVQALGLIHGENSSEVACYLLDPSRIGADKVQTEVQRLALEEGLIVGKGYFTDFLPDKVVDLYLEATNSC